MSKVLMGVPLVSVQVVVRPIPGQSERPLSLDLGELPSLWPNSTMTTSPGRTDFAIGVKRFSTVKERAERSPMALLVTGVVENREGTVPNPLESVDGEIVSRLRSFPTWREGGEVLTISLLFSTKTLLS